MNRPRMSDFDLEVFYDGGCPLCRREITMLRRRDRDQRFRFTDIEALGFSPEALGRTREELMARIHALLPDGTWICGVEVFRRLYAGIGFQRLVRVSRWPVISPLLDIAYGIFARNRRRLTGRCSSETCEIQSGRGQPCVDGLEARGLRRSEGASSEIGRLTHCADRRP